MTSVQVKKGEKGATEEDRQKLLKQMKVRTTLKKDKSWIHQQNSEDEKDEIPSPTSPQLKSLEGRKSLWSPKPDTKTERNSGTFTAKEIITSSSSPPVQSINKRFSYSTNETSSSTSTTSQPSPPPSTTGNKQASSYIIRGQPFNAVSQVKSPPTYNGYQKSTVQARTTSLPRVPTATGYKMSTDEYKKLAPYNIRNKSADLSDEETPFTPQEQVKRTEQASGILRNTSSKDRSYVISAAKRNSGHIPQDTPSPFMAKRVEIIEGENTANRKSQTLPKSLSSYLYDDANRFENNWKETQSKQTPSQTSPLRTSERSSSPQMTSYSTSSTSETRSSSVTPEPGKITVVREESHRDNKEAPKPAAQKETATRRTAGTRTERVETTGNKSESLPEFLASYLYDDVSRFEKNWQENQLKQSTSQTSPPRVIDRPESPKVTLWSANTETSSSVKPEPGKITVLKEESDKSPPKTTTTRTVTTRTESGNSNPAIPILNMYSDVTESKSSSRQSGTGKITVLREDSMKDVTDIPNLTSSTISTSVTESTKPGLQAGQGKITHIKIESMKDVTDIPNLTSSTISTSVTESTKPGLQAGQGKITHIKIESEPDRRSVPSRSSEITTTTTRTTVTTEIRNESTPPKPVPRMEAKPKDTPVASSGPQPDLISWSDLDDITVAKEKTTTPTPVPRHTNKDSEKPSLEPPLIVISPELKSNRPNQPLTPGAINTANESRYRVSETLDEPVLNPKNTQLISDSGNRSVTSTTTETRSERSRTPELPKSERSSSPRPTPRPRENTTTTVTESRYRVPDTLEDTMLESSPSRSSSRTTVTTTRSADPIYTEYLEEVDPRSRRTISSSTEKITTSSTLETHLENTTSREASQYDPQSSSNKGVLFVKEYVNTSESLKSPTTTGSLPNFSDDSERLSYSSSSSYLYSSAPKRSDEGPCTYCGREIKDCAKIILEHLNIYCHEYCFKCGICHKPMGDLIDNLFIHRDVVHCESCYDKLF